MKTPIAAFMVSLCPCVATVAERPDSTLNSMKIRHAVLLTMMLAITSSLQSQTMACYARSGNEKKTDHSISDARVAMPRIVVRSSG